MKILIVGGGFGGVKAALELAKRGTGSITLVSDKPYFLHHATLYSTAAGGDPKESVVPLKEIFKNYKNVKIVNDTISKIDALNKKVKGKTKSYDYDQLILSVGYTDHFYGISGAKRYSYSARSLDGIQSFQKEFHDGIAVNSSGDFTTVIVGGGTTGVELAGALSEYAKHITNAHGLELNRSKITLVERGRRLLPGVSQSATKKIVRRLKNSGVKIMTRRETEKITSRHLTIGGKRVESNLTVWTCGGQNNQFFTKHSDIFCIAKNGRVVVNQCLEAYPSISVIGDNANVKDSGLASSALRHATFVAKRIDSIAKNKRFSKIYRPSRFGPVMSIPLSRFWAYSEWGGVYAAGVSGSMVRRMVELNNYCHFLPFKKAYKSWRRYRVNSHGCRLCKSRH